MPGGKCCVYLLNIIGKNKNLLFLPLITEWNFLHNIKKMDRENPSPVTFGLLVKKVKTITICLTLSNIPKEKRLNLQPLYKNCLS